MKKETIIDYIDFFTLLAGIGFMFQFLRNENFTAAVFSLLGVIAILRLLKYRQKRLEKIMVSDPVSQEPV